MTWLGLLLLLFRDARNKLMMANTNASYYRGLFRIAKFLRTQQINKWNAGFLHCCDIKVWENLVKMHSSEWISKILLTRRKIYPAAFLFYLYAKYKTSFYSFISLLKLPEEECITWRIFKYLNIKSLKSSHKNGNIISHEFISWFRCINSIYGIHPDIQISR